MKAIDIERGKGREGERGKGREGERGILNYEYRMSNIEC